MRFETWYKKIHNYPLGRFSLHLALWLFFYAVQYYILEISIGTVDEATAYLAPLKNTATTMIGFYLLVYVVAPLFRNRKKHALAILAFILVIIIYALTDYGFERVILTSCDS
jgi:hypothetical protein